MACWGVLSSYRNSSNSDMDLYRACVIILMRAYSQHFWLWKTHNFVCAPDGVRTRVTDVIQSWVRHYQLSHPVTLNISLYSLLEFLYGQMTFEKNQNILKSIQNQRVLSIVYLRSIHLLNTFCCQLFTDRFIDFVVVVYSIYCYFHSCGGIIKI